MFYYTHTSPIGKKLEIFFKICINFLKKKIYSNLLHFLRGRVDIGLIFNCSPRFIRVFIVSSISYRTLTISKFCVWPPLRGRNRVFLMWVLVGETLVVWLFCCLSTFYNLHSFYFFSLFLALFLDGQEDHDRESFIGQTGELLCLRPEISFAWAWHAMCFRDKQ